MLVKRYEMLKIGFMLTKCVHVSRSSNTVLRRTFLSESYRCREAWAKRLESTLLKKVKTQSLFQEIDAQFSKFERVSAIDVDIFLNSCTQDDPYIEDVETVVSLLRLCPDSSFTLPSTHHAVVRLLLDAGKTDTLLKILSDRMKFGIFPDQYCCNLLMDTFLKEKRYAAAARVAVSQMLQEDWENILTTRLSVYSCHMYLRNADQTWYSDGEIVAPPPEPKELVRVRVKYLRSPYFDDHFDLNDPSLLVGKTLAMFSSKIRGPEILSASYLLIGLTLHQKWDKVIELAQSLSSRNAPVFREAIQLARNSLHNSSDAEKPSKTEGIKNPSLQQPGGKDQKTGIEEIKLKVDSALQSLESNASSEDALQQMEILVKEAVNQQESTDIEEQVKLYTKWDEDRISALRKQKEELRKEETLKKIEEQKAQLVQEEREVFFFDNEDNLDLLIEKREEEFASLDWIKERKKSAKELKEEADAVYVPPEVNKKHYTS